MREVKAVRRHAWSMAITVWLVGLSLAGVTLAQQTTPSPAPGAATKSKSKPDPAHIQQTLQHALDQFRSVKDGKNADYIPALAKVESNLWSIVIVTVDGQVYEGGDTRAKFSIQSAAKPFVLARAMTDWGPEAVQKRI